jgi:hypothetical protein
LSRDWKPDDSFIEGDAGSRRIREALEEYGIKIEKGYVLTSRDPNINQVRHRLRRPEMLEGFRQWQLPVQLNECPTFFFLTVADPGAVVPAHSHTRDLFRIVVLGGITLHDGRKLGVTDWMFVPAGTDYGYSADLNPGATTLHCYG